MKELSGPERQPISGAKPNKLVIFLHGLGADGNDLISLTEQFSEVMPNALFTSPNAPFPCDMAPMGYQWFSLQDRAEDVIYEGILQAAPLLNSFIASKLEESNLSIKDLVLIGFSQGTMMALHVAPRMLEKCAAVIGFSGALIKPDRLTEEIKSRPNILLAHGENDTIVPPQSTVAAESFLSDNSINVEAHIFDNLEHGIDYREITLAKEFLRKTLYK